MPDSRRAYLQQCILISLRKRWWYLLPSGPLVAFILTLVGLRLPDAIILGGLTTLLMVSGVAYRSYQRHQDDVPNPYKQPT